MDQILDFQRRFAGRDLLEHAACSPSSIGDRTLPVFEIATVGFVAVALVFHGRWLALCPFGGGCGGAEYVDFSTLAFFCCECRNDQVGARLVPVLAPAERDEIEAILLERPARHSMNYLQGETLEELREQTATLLAGEGV